PARGIARMRNRDVFAGRRTWPEPTPRDRTQCELTKLPIFRRGGKTACALAASKAAIMTPAAHETVFGRRGSAATTSSHDLFVRPASYRFPMTLDCVDVVLKSSTFPESSACLLQTALTP